MVPILGTRETAPAEPSKGFWSWTGTAAPGLLDSWVTRFIHAAKSQLGYKDVWKATRLCCDNNCIVITRSQNTKRIKITPMIHRWLRYQKFASTRDRTRHCFLHAQHTNAYCCLLWRTAPRPRFSEFDGLVINLRRIAQRMD